MRPRIAEELELLREQYGEVEHAEAAGEDWFKLPRYQLPPGWRLGDEAVDQVPVAFPVTAAYPGAAPYGFLAPADLNFEGKGPLNAKSPPKAPPFEGNWMHFSWSVEDWRATDAVRKGSNLFAWARSFRQRFKEGA